MANVRANAYVACNLCDRDMPRYVTTQNHCTIVRCNNCGFVYVNPRPEDGAYKELYTDYLPDRMENPLDWKAYMERVYKFTADLIEARITSKGRFMDIGCGFGFFVEVMRDRGWKASGVDISHTAVSYARERGLDVDLGLISDSNHVEGTFDAITMFYVLEHVTSPVETLKEVLGLLRPGGLLVLRLPHTTPIVRMLDLLHINNNLYDPPFHLSDFSPDTINRMLAMVGYREVRTLIGGATLPLQHLPRLVSLVSNSLAETLYRLTGGKFLLPGVSKTTVAIKPRFV